MLNKSSFFIVGKHAVVEALKNPKRKVLKVFLTEESKKTIHRISPNKNLLKDQKVFFKTKRELDKYCGKDQIQHQGFAAEINYVDEISIKEFIKNKKNITFACLDNVTDPRNIGSIIRSAASFDVDGLIVKDRNYPKNSKLMYKSASGSMEHINIFSVSNIKTTIKFFDNSFLLQEKDELVFNKKNLRCVTKNKPSIKELRDIEFAFRMCKYVKSNAIVVVKDNSTIGIGAGQQNRLDSSKIAVQKAKKFQPRSLHNSVAASDAFFPFADGIKVLINAGVKTIVQPGGSIRDKEVIEEANRSKVKMIFTGTRHFNH